ncbi:MAG: hypothetical protein L0Y50_05580 [Beijerinckiaceae bacterium]|nr:hypothetical protein [Beijerinckiaceae bacterium]
MVRANATRRGTEHAKLAANGFDIAHSPAGGRAGPHLFEAITQSGHPFA